MKLKHALMVPLMGRQADRFHEYQPAHDLPERLAMVRRVRGVDGIEIVYPQDFADPRLTVAMVQDAGLPVSAVNLNVKSAKKWQSSSFTSTNPQLRADALADLKTAMDLAAELDAWMVTCCPLIDGHNYNFQVDYLKQWGWLEEGLAEAARHRSDVRISLEYKLNESRNYVILGDMGRTLYLCERLGMPHVGVTMDVGHALVAKETPAEMLCLAAQARRLFYVHFNDNGREWDWDMLPGSVNLWDLVEMAFYLDRLDWEGWLAYDVLTRDGDPVKTMDATIAIVQAAEALLDKLGREKLQAFIGEGIPAHAFEYLVRSLL
ncbi:MAG: sugar phosphate isomerase/epimerase [Anaerolineae bacterium]|nr:MAG: sugar phosphate isomerase/epimerase [Anaerolineae bacterium]